MNKGIHQLISAALLSLTLASCASTSDCPECGAGGSTAPLAGTASGDGGHSEYTIPIVVSPGRAEMQPDLSVWYSSANGVGILGLGWQINSTSSIFRCSGWRGETDAPLKVVHYNATDSLCIDGQILVLATGQQGQSGSTYRTWLETFVQVRLVGNLDDPDAYFIAIHKDGTRVYYKSKAIPAHKSAPLYWYETYREDTVGNVISYSYSEPKPGDLLVTEIAYTGRMIHGALSPGDRLVRFTYETRPDVSITWLEGGESRGTERLRSVTTGIRNAANPDGMDVVREYHFHYGESTTNHRSLLDRVTGCAYDTKHKRYCLTPTLITWSAGSPRYAPPRRIEIPDLQEPAPEWSEDNRSMPTRYMANQDYNGDGPNEIVRRSRNGSAHAFITDIGGHLLQDVDLGRSLAHTEVNFDVGPNTDLYNIGAYTAMGEIDGHLATASWDGKDLGSIVRTSIPFSSKMIVGSFRAAWHMDVLQLEDAADGKQVLRLYQNLNSKPGSANFAPALDIVSLPTSDASGRAHQYLLGRGRILQSSGYMVPSIMDGGRLSLLVLFDRDENGKLTSRVVTPEQYGVSARAVETGVYFADINGDGLADIVYSDGPLGKPTTWHYQINTGNQFGPEVDTGIADERPTQSAVTSTRTIDIGIDGRDALIYPSERLVDYCIRTSPASEHPSNLLCSGKKLDEIDPSSDFGIYRFDVLRFVARADGRFVPEVLEDTNIIAQANRLIVGDIDDDGLDDVASPFDAAYSNGGFSTNDRDISPCPPNYGCGFRIASNMSALSPDRKNAAPDLAIRIARTQDDSYEWNYYPISNSVRDLYLVPPYESVSRFIDDDHFYYRSSQYVVGEFISHHGRNAVERQFKYAGAVHDILTGGFAGFHWIESHSDDDQVRSVSWFDQLMPYDGELVTAWEQPDDEPEGDPENGEPGPNYIWAERREIDCQGPSGAMKSIKFDCIDSKSPTFRARERLVTKEGREPYTLQVVATEKESQDFDLYGNQTLDDDVVTKDGETTFRHTRRKFADPDLNDWWVNNLSSESRWTGDTDISKAADAKTTEYEYNNRRQVKKKSEVESGNETVTRYTYEEDESKGDFGELIEIQTEQIDLTTHEMTQLPTKTFHYDADGYPATDKEDEDTD